MIRELRARRLIYGGAISVVTMQWKYPSLPPSSSKEVVEDAPKLTAHRALLWRFIGALKQETKRMCLQVADARCTEINPSPLPAG